MRICTVCGKENSGYETVCRDCGRPLSHSDNKLYKNCEECHAPKSRKVKINDNERNLCFQCCMDLKYKNYWHSPDKKNLWNKKYEALHKWREALYYGEDATAYQEEYEKC